jgi:tyrosine-protein kinase Etk/Wzc
MKEQSNLTADGDQRDDRIDLAHLLDLLAGGWRVVAACSVGALLVAAAYLYLAPPIYRGDILLQVEQAPQFLPGFVEYGMAQPRPTEAEIELLGSRLVLGDVVDRLDLTLVAEPVGGGLLNGWRDGGGVPTGIIVERFELPGPLAGHELRLRAGTPGAYQLVLAGNGRVLGSGRVGETAASADLTGLTLVVSELSGPAGAEFRLLRRHRFEVIDELRTGLRIVERGSHPYISTGILEVSMEHRDPAHIARVLNALGNVYVRQNVERRSEEARLSLAFLEQQMPALRRELEQAEESYNRFRREHQAVDLSADTRAMLERLVEIETELKQTQIAEAELSLRYGAQHPEMRALQSRRRSLAEVRAELEAHVDLLPDRQQDLMRLQRDVDANTQLYTSLLNNQQELRVMQAGTIGNVRIVDGAEVGPEPVRPRTAMALALGLIAGLLGGIGTVFGRETLRRTIADPEQLERRLGVPVYAVVPHSRAQRRLTRRHVHGLALLARDEPDDLAVEALRSLRTSLSFGLGRKPRNVVALTSPGPEAGKTFAAANLSFLAAQTGQRVLLIDADLRRGHLHQYLAQAERGRGLSEVLAGQAEAAEVQLVIGRDAGVDLHVLTTGAIPPNPSELLMRPAFADLVESAADAYDLVIIDTAPLLAVTDALLAASHAGVVLIVVRAGRTREGEARAAMRRLQQNGAPMTGMVLNDFDPARPGAAPYHYYQYDYRSDR